MAKRKGRKRLRRPKYTADKPLELAVQIPRVEAVPAAAWRAALSRPLFAFVDALPEVADTASGRKKAQTIRVILAVTALFLVITARDGDWWLGALGVATGLTLVFVPLSGLRKARWKHRLSRVTGGGERVVQAPASLHFNGTKLTIRDDANGKVWTSTRPLVTPHLTVWGERHGEAWLGIINPRGKKRDAVWIRSAQAIALLEGQPPLAQALGQHVPWTLDRNVTGAAADAAAFEALYRALGPAPTSPSQ